MANKGNQKLKLLYIMEMLTKESDENHLISAQDIIDRLKAYEIEAERKSIYRDIKVLQEYGMDIVNVEKQGCYLASREFELPELKLLVDAVLASKFITEKKSNELVGKIEKLGSVYQGKHLQRQVVVSDRVKAANESIYYTIDEIYNCIDNNHRLEFQYADWNEKKEQILRHDGEKYQVSPEFLLWDNEYYYLVAFDEKTETIRHYRVDRMRYATETDKARGGQQERASIKKADYTKKHFGMFAGETRTVRLRVPKSMAGIMIDRFGAEVPMRADGDDYIIIRSEVDISGQFYGWITGLGSQVTIEGPDDIARAYKDYLENIIRNY